MDEMELKLDKVEFIANKAKQLVERGMTIKNAYDQALLYFNLIEEPFAVNYIIFKEDELASNYFSEDASLNDIVSNEPEKETLYARKATCVFSKRQGINLSAKQIEALYV